MKRCGVDSLAPGQGAVIVAAVPFSAPSEVAHLQAKRPLGTVISALWGQEWARLPTLSRLKYCHNGGMAFAHQQRGAWLK
jgi:hypothetical protein